MIEALRQSTDVSSSSKEEIRSWERPEIILGGMGVAISNWKLCREAAIVGEKLGEKVLPFVSGTGLPYIMADRLQSGDSDTIRALRVFDEVSGLKLADKIINKYSVKPKDEKHIPTPKAQELVLGTEEKKAEMEELTVAAAFVESYLAKEGHNSPIGINLLEKIQPMILPTLLGAMMAGVDFVEMGAGIPSQVPKVIDDYSNNAIASYSLDDAGDKEIYKLTLDPKRFTKDKLKKPKFYPIVSMHVLAMKLSELDGVDGFIVAGNTAGHRMNPRDKKNGVINGQSYYSEKDIPDLDKIRELKDKLGNPLPFWLAGAYADRLKEAQELGAAGVQAASIFEFCDESGLREDLKRQSLDLIARTPLEDLGKLVKKMRWVSPTNYTFSVLQLEGSLSQDEIHGARDRACKYGCLTEYYLKSDGKLGFRCPADRVDIFVRTFPEEKQNGAEKLAMEARCLCEGLTSTAGHANGDWIVTAGELAPVRELILKSKNGGRYSAEDALRYVASHR